MPWKTRDNSRSVNYNIDTSIEIEKKYNDDDDDNDDDTIILILIIISDCYEPCSGIY